MKSCYNDDISPIKNDLKVKPPLLKDVMKKAQGTNTLLSVDVKSNEE